MGVGDAEGGSPVLPLADPYWNIGNMVYGNNPSKNLTPNIAAIRQSLNLYTYCMNNPIRYHDSTGNDAWLIHGTWSSPATWTDGFRDYLGGEVLAGEAIHTAEWTGENSSRERVGAARALANEIIAWREQNPHEPIRLIGHSHGGNVAMIAMNMLPSEGIRVDTLITIATPIREYGYGPASAPRQHINVYNVVDVVQVAGGAFLPARRTYSGATNIQVPLPAPTSDRGFSMSGVAAHSFMHSDVEVWRQHITPVVHKTVHGQTFKSYDGGRIWI